MADSRNTGGARALLFERLVDTELSRTEESPPFRVLTRQELWQSVSRELGRLLNSRCPVPLKLIGAEERNVINYGIPDFTSLSPQSADDRKLIASIIGQTITAFETRLRNVQVTAEYFADDERTLHISVEADLVTDTVIEIRSYAEFSSSVEPVSFPIVLHSKTGIMEIYER
ncbi:MAG TPA: type VI secretion system baseplate subunit TssE [Pyrinomonadaceae bacterium]|nr:type VI secretion system baseplate subunit TssE [Pyrinomonadaceae bacterium]